MEENKKRRQAPAGPEFDLAGPAAWGDESPDRPRPRVRKRPRPEAETAESRNIKIKAAPGGKKSGDDAADGQIKKKSNGGKRPPKPPRGKKKRGFFLRFVIWLLWAGLGLAVIGAVAGIIGYSYVSPDLPSTEGLRKYAPPTVTYIYSDDGRVVGEYYSERRFVVPVEQISPVAINAILAVEDADFYKHKGVNPKAIARAFLTNMQSGGIEQGGSTITQQVVKTFLLTPERSYIRKFKEMILAVRIERNLTKEEILYLYLNQIYLGKKAYGVEAAARTYFNKSAMDLSISEAAQVAGIIRSPNRNPLNDPQHAEDRRITALQRMLDAGVINEAQYQEARSEKLHLQDEWPNPNTTVAPYFTEHVRRMMEERFGERSLNNDGWKIYTTVNIEDQKAADAAVARGLWEFARRRGYKGPAEELDSEAKISEFLAKADLELAGREPEENRLYQAVIMDIDAKNNSLSVNLGSRQGIIGKKNLDWALNKAAIAKRFKTGDVVWVRLAPRAEAKGEEVQVNSVSGSLAPRPLELILEQRTDVQSALLSMDLQNGDVKAMVGGRDFRESQFNRAVQSQRQPGSSFKPILYASAMDHGFTPGSVMNDAPFVIDDPGSGKRWKPVNSDLKFKGPMTLYTALVGSRNLISVKILDRIGYEALAQTARDLGITEKLPESLTIALGAHGIHIPEMVSAYSAFANMGQRVEPRYITRIEDRYGNVLTTFEAKRIPSLDPGSACAVTWMLRGVVEQGTGTSVKPLGRPVAGKTGTTNDYSDAWFIGFTPELVTAVWVGTDQQRPNAVARETGGRVAGPIFLYYMREALKGLPKADFIVPEGAEIAPGGPFGICYKAGTIGTGLSELVDVSNPEDDFLREDFEGMEGEILGADYPTGPEEGNGGFMGIFRRNAAPPSPDPVPVQAPPATRPPDIPGAAASSPPPAAPAAEPVFAPAPLPAESRPVQPASGGGGRLAPYGENQGSAPGRLSTYGADEMRPPVQPPPPEIVKDEGAL